MKKLLLNKETMSVLNAREMSKIAGQVGAECPKFYTPFTVLLPNPADPSTFFSCSNGVPILMNCPDGLIFNDKIDHCDWPSMVNREPEEKPKNTFTDSTNYCKVTVLMISWTGC